MWRLRDVAVSVALHHGLDYWFRFDFRKRKGDCNLWRPCLDFFFPKILKKPKIAKNKHFFLYRDSFISGRFPSPKPFKSVHRRFSTVLGRMVMDSFGRSNPNTKWSLLYSEFSICMHQKMKSKSFGALLWELLNQNEWRIFEVSTFWSCVINVGMLDSLNSFTTF